MAGSFGMAGADNCALVPGPEGDLRWWRWPRNGCNTHTQRARRPKPRDARPPGRWPLGLDGGRAELVRQFQWQSALPKFHVRPKRWVKMVCPPGISRSKPSNTVRAE